MKSKSSSSIFYSLLLVLTATIWGAAFVAQSAGMENVGPLTFNCIRFILGSIVLLPVIAIMDKKGLSASSWKDKDLYKGGIICGTCLFLASASQQIGIVYTTVGKAGFITAFYIVMVPIFSIILKKKPGKLIWLSVIMGVVGLYLLCINGDSFTIAKGDPYLFACAILFSIQIIAIDTFAPKVDCLKLSCVQFAVAGILGIIPMMTEHPTLTNVLSAWIPIGYAGFFSSGIAYTLQTVSQKHVKPAVASLIMSLESVFAVIFGFLLLHQTLSLREGLGCIVMFLAVILAQFEPGKTEA
ncbi:MAG: DMT family transporter [Lachnospiraceae bacterium]|nr:DMT family transporter [Lachnospiraceae bacterium]